MIVIVDYKMGNPNSIRNMLHRIGVEAVISSSPELVAQADRLILPGVGAFDAGMTNIKELGLLEVLHEKALKTRTPVLGICLGMGIDDRR